MVQLGTPQSETPQHTCSDPLAGEELFAELERIVRLAGRRPQVRRPLVPDDLEPPEVRDSPLEVRAAERALDEVQAVIDFVDADGIAAVLEDVSRLRAMAEAAEASAIHRLEETRADVNAGFRNPTAAVKTIARTKHSDAARRVGLAQTVRDLPVTWSAWESGWLSESHVARLVQASRGHRRKPFLQVEQLLLEAALRLPYRRFCAVIAQFEQMTEPDLDDWDERERAKRSAELRRCRRERGGGTLEATLDAVGYEVFARTLQEIERELFEADWAEATDRVGQRNVTVDDLGRTPTQRRADALVEMAQRANSAPAGGRKPRPSVVVHISHEAFEAELKRRVGADFVYPADFTAELSDGTPISPGRALALAVEGEVRRLVFDGPDIRTRFGRSKRFADGALREMIEARDRHCQAPGCDVPAWRCDVDHIIDWQHDGETNGDDLELKCRWHNGNKSQYEISTDPVTGAVSWRRARKGSATTRPNASVVGLARVAQSAERFTRNE